MKQKNITWNLSKQNLPYLVAKLNELDFDINWIVKVSEQKSTRSLEQNARLWALYTSIGNWIGEDQDSIHEYMRNKFLKTVKEINGEQVITFESTTKLNTERMAEYQTKIEAWAATELGWSFENDL